MNRMHLLHRRAALIWTAALPGALLAPAAALASAAAGSTAAASFDLQAHRGGRGLQPENTLAAFEHALELGVSTLELDLALTADGVPVIVHDSALNPAHTRDASGAFLSGTGPAVHTLSLEQLQRYDVGRLDPASQYGQQYPQQAARDGQRIPALRELFALVQQRGARDVRFNLEPKTDPTAPASTAPVEALVRAVLDEVQRAGLSDRVTVQSFDWRAQALAAQLAPTISLAWLTSGRTLRDARWTRGLQMRDFGGSVPQLVKAAAADTKGTQIWSPAFTNLQATQVREAQGLGLHVVPWTVNEPVDLARAMDMGVNGIITDYPDRLRALMRERGLPLPRGIKN